MGSDVIDVGQLPTPTLQHAIRHHGAAGGIMITASHNPAVWNGLKLMDSSGSFLDTDAYTAYQAAYARTYTGVAWDKTGQLSQDTAAIQRHVDLIISQIILPDLSNISILVDANHGTGCLATPVLLDKLGVRYTLLQSAADGLFSHPPEPLETHLGTIMRHMQSGDYSIGFVQDPDADRLVIIDETGRYIGEEYTLGLCLDQVLRTAPAHQTIAVNLSTSHMIDDIAGRYNARVIRTKIGETHVTAALKNHKGLIGGEGNGGVIYTPVGWGRDSLTGIALILQGLAGRSVSAWQQTLPRYYVTKKTLSQEYAWSDLLARLDALFPNYTRDITDGVKYTGDHAWIQVRQSNTEPIIRVFAEATTQAQADSLVNQVLSGI